MYMRRGVLALILLAVTASVDAASVAGRDYLVLNPPQRPDSRPGKIEVIEFFSWGCPHCYEFYPLLSSWQSKLPRDVEFKRVPVGFAHPQWENLARAYYALEVTGDVARLDSQLFEAIHKEHLPLFDEGSITEWVGKHGVDTKKFSAAYNSFGVNASMARSEQLRIGYKVEFVPTLAVAGRYSVTGDHAQMINTSNELIAKARTELAARK
jgi:thiol:disulfide interchange protein DsbA